MISRDPGGGGSERLRPRLQVEVERVSRLRFDDGSPVRAASGLARLGEGWLVVQDDANHAAWCHRGGVRRLRIFPAIERLDHFGEADATKHLKPDLEAACELQVMGEPAVLLLGSGSSPLRTRVALVRLHDGDPAVVVAELDELYTALADALGVGLEDINVEGACWRGRDIRLFNRGNRRRGVASASADVAVADLLAAFDAAANAGGDARPMAAADRTDPAQIRPWPLAVGNVRRYDLGTIEGVGLSVTDALYLPDGRLVLSAAAEDSGNNIDDGFVTGAALALFDGAQRLAVAMLRTVAGRVAKLEGIALLETLADGCRLLGVVDDDDPTQASLQLVLRLRLD